MVDETRVAAFCEYVLRPLSEDWRAILDQLKSLNIGITQETIKDTCFALGLWHLTGEIIRAVTYILITIVICRTIQTVLLPL
jgi:hypothetical protein